MSNKHKKNIIPVIDLFAGPGGLNEGFSHKIGGKRRFKSVLSVEKEAPEHQTLSLRAFYRYFLYRDLPVPQEYYDYIQKRNNVTREQLWKKYPDAAAEADNEALQFTLGEDDGPLGFPFLADKIKKALGGEKNWLLIGGPPCQAYSLVGRSKQLGELKKKEGSISGAEQKFYLDHRHKLYRQYLRILAYFAPAVFVMENVKGILSAKLNGDLIFPQIINAHIQAAVEIGMEVFVIGCADLEDLRVLIHDDASVKHLRIGDEDRAGCVIDSCKIVRVSQTDLLDCGAVVVTVEAVVMIRLDADLVLQLEKASLRRTLVHRTVEPACLLVQIERNVGGFLGKRTFPVGEAAADTLFFDKVDQRNTVTGRLEKVFPEIVDLASPVVFLKICKQFAVGGDKFSTGNHKKHSKL